MKWLIIRNVEGGAITVERLAPDAKGFPQPTGEIETLEADLSRIPGTGQGCRPVLFCPDVGPPEVRDGVVQVGSEHDDRRGYFRAGGDMVPTNAR